MSNHNKESVSQMIRKAYMQLLHEKYYLDITVIDIVREAGVARASFYRNFDSINDVLNSIIDEIVTSVRETVVPVLRSDEEGPWREFLFNFIYDFRVRHKTLVTSYPANIYVILFRLNDRLTRMENELEPADIEEKYRLGARFGMILMVLKSWVDTGMKETPEALINYLMSRILAI